MRLDLGTYPLEGPPQVVKLRMRAASRSAAASYGFRRSRLRGHDGARTWIGWGVLAYNLDTLVARTVQTA